MEQERRTVPFECQRCWHVWQEDYVVQHTADRHGNDIEVWLRDGVRVPPPSAEATCVKCGSAKVTTFPDGYLTRHPEAAMPGEPSPLDDERLRSPVPRRMPWIT
ncbi:hypothetical protein [Thermoactinospora rubra]|uniref:hypothetical protein n=1 Tax=Thermoactinospora rubra TaxID=1088767 RepID=UPI00118163A9|nr:hypothetical protein [Thermoactinospora rubra]